MIELDLKVNSLDDLFESMTVWHNPLPKKGENPRQPPYEIGYFFCLTGPVGSWKSIYAVPKLALRQVIEQWCCEGKIGSIQPKEQWGGRIEGKTTNNTEYAIIANDSHMIASIRVCLLMKEQLVFNGVSVLDANLPVGEI